MKKDETIKIAIADDHKLLRKGMVQLLQDSGYRVLADAGNGKELIDKIKNNPPHIVLMDINMPLMNGIEATQWLKENMPAVRVIAISMFDDEMYIIRMIRAGARGYLLKDAEPQELRKAIREVHERGFHYTDLVTGKLVHHISGNDEEILTQSKFSDREEEFLKLSCTEMTYKEIADKMIVSPRTVDGYREALFEKLGLKSRVGLVLYAVKHGFVVA